MAFNERIRLVIDVATGNSRSQLSRLKTDLQSAETRMDKLRVAGGGAFDLIKQNVATLATAGGAALIAFGAKAVSEFNAVALGAGELRDALGVTAEEASRLQEVAGDLGISVEDLQTTIGRMNRAAASTPGAFDAIGASIVRAADGSIDVTETFISTAEALNRIPDAARRAEAGQQIFGRGWQNISELIMQGADGIRDAMASVEGGKIIDDAEIERAREFRDTMDSIKGVVEQTVVETGNLLTSAALGAQRVGSWLDPFDDDNVGGVMGNLANLVGLTEDLAAALGDMPAVDGTIFDLGSAQGLGAYAKALQDVGVEAQFVNGALIVNGEVLKQIPWVGTATEVAAYNRALTGYGEANERAMIAARQAEAQHRRHFAALEDTGSAADDAAEAMRRAEAATAKLERAAENLERQWDELTDELDERDAYRGLEDAFDDLETAATEAFEATQTGAEDADAKVRAHQQSVDDLKRRVIEYGRSILGLSPERTTKLLVDIDQGQYAWVKTQLDRLAWARTVRYVASTLPATSARRSNITGVQQAMAEGGTAVGGPTLVGEEGPEIVDMPRGAKVYTADETKRMLAGGGGSPLVTGASSDGARVVNVTINTGADPKAVVDAIRKYERHNGPGWRS